jgi:hypothetical protein
MAVIACHPGVDGFHSVSALSKPAANATGASWLSTGGRCSFLLVRGAGGAHGADFHTSLACPQWPACRGAAHNSSLLGRGGIDEFYQGFVPGRDSSLEDVLTDVAGATIGALSTFVTIGAWQRPAPTWMRWMGTHSERLTVCTRKVHQSETCASRILSPVSYV